MKPIIYAMFAGAALLALPAPPAEAARCPQGSIYRPSMGVCQPKGKSIRYTRQKASRSEIRRARAEARREARRAKAEAAATRKAAEPRRPVTMPRSPLMATIAPDPFIAITDPYGRLVVPLPAAFERHVLAWAHENKHRLAREIAE